MVELKNPKVSNCMLTVNAGAAPILISNFVGGSISGGVKRSSQRVLLNSVSGRVSVNGFSGDTLSVVSRSAVVEMESVDAPFVRVGSNTGAVQLKKMFPTPSDNNNLQIETVSGKVTVDIQPDGFKGEFTLWSSNGAVSIVRNGNPLPSCPVCTTKCSLDPTQTNCQADGRLCSLYCLNNNTGSTSLATGRIGCYENECGYYGEMLVTSNSGRISVVLNV
jgi:hypothetical protein